MNESTPIYDAGAATRERCFKIFKDRVVGISSIGFWGKYKLTVKGRDIKFKFCCLVGFVDEKKSHRSPIIHMVCCCLQAPDKTLIELFQSKQQICMYM